MREKMYESSWTLAQTLTPYPEKNFLAFLSANLDLAYIEGPLGGLEVKLVGGKTLQDAGDK